MKKRRFTEGQMQNEFCWRRGTRKRVVKPTQRKVMVQWSVQDKSVSIVLACATSGISETCYQYRPVLNDENEEIADWLLRLTTCHNRWDFGLYFLYLRNVKVFGWNHKRVYRIS